MIVALTGCHTDLGGQVRRSLSQSKIYEWRPDGSFRMEANGPQTEGFIMAQGKLKMITDENGVEVVDWPNSEVEKYLRADPSGDAASNAMTHALQASTQQDHSKAIQILQMGDETRVTFTVPTKIWTSIWKQLAVEAR